MRVACSQKIKSGLVLLFLLSVVSIPCHALDLEKVAPKSIQTEKAPAQMPTEMPTSEVDSAAKKTLLLKNLKGLVFLRDPQKVITSGMQAEGVHIDGYLSESFFEDMGGYLNQPLYLENLNDILKKVVVYFRTQSTPVVDVYVPEQDITEGTVQVVILEGRVGIVKAEGNKFFSSKSLEGQIRTQPGEVIHGNSLAEDVDWLNKNPFRHVDLLLARGEERGQTDVILRTEDRFPLRLYGGYENSGNELTGRDRFLAGLNWGNAFDRGHLLDAQFTTSSNLSRMKAVSLHYEIPMDNHRTLEFFAAYAKSVPDLDPFALSARSWELGSRYVMELPAVKLFRHNLNLGAEYKFSNSNLDFSNIPVFDKKTEILQAVVGYTGSMPDIWGRTAFNMEMVYSPGSLLNYNNDESFDQYRTEASATYLYYKLDVDRLTALPKDFSWNVKARLQFSNGPLLGSEQLGLGGYSSVRGFEEREVNSDEGILLVNEIRTPNYDLSSKLHLPFRAGSLQFLGFWDYGLGNNRSDPDGSHVVSSMGFGGRYRFGSNVSLRFDYGWQLNGKDEDIQSDSLGHVGLVVAY